MEYWAAGRCYCTVAIHIRRKKFLSYSFWPVRAYIVINLCHALLRIWVADELWYYWLAPACLLNYVIFLWENNAAGRLRRSEER